MSSDRNQPEVDILLISPVMPQAVSQKRRKITPTPELSSLRGNIVICPLEAVPDGSQIVELGNLPGLDALEQEYRVLYRFGVGVVGMYGHILFFCILILLHP